MELEAPKIDIDINAILRFGGIGGLILLLIVNENEDVLNNVQKMGPIVIPMIALVAGHIFYSVYRYLFYDYLVTAFQDLFYRNSKKHNYRTYIKNKFNCTSLSAQHFYTDMLRHQINLRSYATVASTIHLMYMVFLILLPYGIYVVLGKLNSYGYFYILVSFIIGFCGFLMDRKYEQMEYRQVKAIASEAVTNAWNEYHNR